MWFKNVQIFQFNKATPDQAELSSALEKRLFTPCSKLQPHTLGFVPALPEAKEMVHRDQDFLLLSIKRQERLLPASVIKEFLDDKVSEIQQEQDRKVGRKEKADLKEQLIFELLPQAFTRSSLIQLVIDREQGLLLVASASQSRGEEALKLLREVLGSLDISPLSSCYDVSGFLRQCFLGEHESSFLQQLEFELKQPGEEEAVLKHRNHGLSNEEIKERLSEGWQVSKLALNYMAQIAFVLDQQGQLKRLKYLDMGEDNLDQTGSHPAAKAAHEFALWARNFSQMVAHLRQKMQPLDSQG